MIMMKSPKFLKDTVRLAKGESINLDERIEDLEKMVNVKLSNFEDSLQTLHETIINLHNENISLKEENNKMTKTLAERIGEGSTSILGGFRERIIQPVLKEGEEFAEFMLDDDDEKCPGIKPEQNKAKPKTYDKKLQRTDAKDVNAFGNFTKNKELTDAELKLDPPGPKFASKINETHSVSSKSKEISNSDPLTQPSLKPHLEIEHDALDPKTKAAKWMRQKFGLPAEIQKRHMKSKSTRSRKMRK
ncbi:MAG: hypothetical protein V1920_02215 [Bacillota bacterium]